MTSDRPTLQRVARDQYEQGPSSAANVALLAIPAVLTACATIDDPAGGAPSFRLPASVTAAEAARFLTQCTFGPTEASIEAVRVKGYAAWLNEQFARPATPHRAYLEHAIANGDPKAKPVAYRGHVMDTFWKQAITGEDPLRQRMVFTLSQFFVVSQAASDVNNRPRGLADYLDTLAAHAFGNFRDLLQAVCLHPVMGLYLSSLRNRKEDPATQRMPDENFAREVMQLFTIGLAELNPDGSLRLDARGYSVPTYGNADVQGLAKVFTGWSWAGPDKTNPRFFGRNTGADPDRDVTPMQAYPQFHSNSAKSFLGITIAPNTGAEPSLKIALDTLFYHPNTPPFVSRQLIQRFVTSNPAPAYVRRVAAAFTDNGHGIRGDLQAVLRAILLDAEARDPARASAASLGKLREPVVRLANWARAFGATSTSGNFMIRNVGDPSTGLGQNPLRSPTVFNFYRPGYVPPATAVAAAGLAAAEFQIVGENSVAGYLNFMRAAVDAGTGIGRDVRAEYRKEMALADEPDRLMDRVDLLLTCGRMSAATRDAITAAVRSVPISAANARLNRAKLAIYLTLASPEFIVQK
jgi:uncharacterized protein (DUF1800 family)